jgi:putative lipoprotein
MRWLVVVAALLAIACSGASAPEPGPLPPPESPAEPHDPWADAGTRGIDFRAVGQEPGWFLEVDHDRGIRLVWDYGEQQMVTAAAVQPFEREGTTMYEGATDTHRLEVAIEEAPCADAMNGQSFPRTVTVNIDGRALRGCGRNLTP